MPTDSCFFVKWATRNLVPTPSVAPMIIVTRGCQVEESTEPAQLGVASGTAGRLARRLNELDEQVTGVNAHPHIGVADRGLAFLPDRLDESRSLEGLDLGLQGLGRLARFDLDDFLDDNGTSVDFFGHLVKSASTFSFLVVGYCLMHLSFVPEKWRETKIIQKQQLEVC